MPHKTIRKLYEKIPAVQYGKRQEERLAKTEQGRELLGKAKTFKNKLKILGKGLKKRLLRYDE